MGWQLERFILSQVVSSVGVAAMKRCQVREATLDLFGEVASEVGGSVGCSFVEGLCKQALLWLW